MKKSSSLFIALIFLRNACRTQVIKRAFTNQFSLFDAALFVPSKRSSVRMESLWDEVGNSLNIMMQQQLNYLNAAISTVQHNYVAKTSSKTKMEQYYRQLKCNQYNYTVEIEDFNAIHSFTKTTFQAVRVFIDTGLNDFASTL